MALLNGLGLANEVDSVKQLLLSIGPPIVGNLTIAEEIAAAADLFQNETSVLQAILTPTLLSPARLLVSNYFTDSNSTLLPTDASGSPKVDVVLSKGTVRSTNPAQILAWANITNTGPMSVDSVRLNETLPVDWTVHPAWLPSKGAVHVYFVYANRTRTEITNPKMITVSSSTANPQTLTLNVPDLNATIAGSPLMSGETVLVSGQLVYSLIGTLQSGLTYPRVHIDSSMVSAWTQPFYAGGQVTAPGFTSLVAYAKVG